MVTLLYVAEKKLYLKCSKVKFYKKNMLTGRFELLSKEIEIIKKSDHEKAQGAITREINRVFSI